jgi:hypothetical protein
MRSSHAIDRLINASVDDKCMLEHESRAVHGHRREVLERLAEEQTRSIAQLTRLSPSDRAEGGSLIELGREVGRTLRGMFGCSTDGDSVSACRQSCRRTEALFDEALDLPWPPATRATLTDARDRLDAANQTLVAIQY